MFCTEETFQVYVGVFVKKIIAIFLFVFSFAFFSFGGELATPTRTPDPADPALSEPWGKVCGDNQIYDLCNKFLIKQFGEKWAKYYTPVEIKKDTNYKVLSVKYSFSGPGNHKSIIDPEFDFFSDSDVTGDCKNLKFWRGVDFIAPYDISKLLTVQEATKIAAKNGIKAKFSSWDFNHAKRLGKLFLDIPQYGAWVDSGPYGGRVIVNADDGSFRFIPT